MNELALNDEKMKLKKMRWFLFLSFWMVVATIFCCSNTPVFADIASSKMATQSKSFITPIRRSFTRAEKKSR